MTGRVKHKEQTLRCMPDLKCFGSYDRIALQYGLKLARDVERSHSDHARVRSESNEVRTATTEETALDNKPTAQLPVSHFMTVQTRYFIKRD